MGVAFDPGQPGAAADDGRRSDRRWPTTSGLAVRPRSGIARGHHADHVRLSGRAARLGDHESARVHVQTAKDQMAGQPRLTERAMFADAVLAMALWFGDDCERARSICAELRAVVTGGPSNSPVQQHVVALVRSVTGFVAAQSGDMSTATADLQVAYPAAVSTRHAHRGERRGMRCGARACPRPGRGCGRHAGCRGEGARSRRPDRPRRRTWPASCAPHSVTASTRNTPRERVLPHPGRLPRSARRGRDQPAGCAGPRPAASNRATTDCR